MVMFRFLVVKLALSLLSFQARVPIQNKNLRRSAMPSSACGQAAELKLFMVMSLVIQNRC